jgi:dihydrolipoamide dehydrogenase
MAVELFMPKMSDFMEEGEVVSWLVKEGDPVEEGQAVMELETDKSLVELRSPASGFIKGMRAGVGPGSKVPVGETLAFVVESMDETVETLAPLSFSG